MIEAITKYYPQCDVCGVYFPEVESWKDSRAISFANPEIAAHNILNFGWSVRYEFNMPMECFCKKCNKRTEYYQNQNLNEQEDKTRG